MGHSLGGCPGIGKGNVRWDVYAEGDLGMELEDCETTVRKDLIREHVS